MFRLLPKDWYTATITQAYKIEKKQALFLRLCFTIDSGEFAYRHIIRDYPINNFGLNKLENHFLEIDRFLFTETDSPLFVEQFIGLRMQVHVDRGKVEDVIKNYILEMKKTTKEAEYDVTKEKKDDHYFKDNKGRELPICEQGTTKMKQFER